MFRVRSPLPIVGAERLLALVTRRERIFPIAILLPNLSVATMNDVVNSISDCLSTRRFGSVLLRAVVRDHIATLLIQPPAATGVFHRMDVTRLHRHNKILL